MAAQYVPSRYTHAFSKGVAIVPGTPFRPCQGVNVTTAGTGTVTWLDGTTSTFYFPVGNSEIQITNVAAAGLSAATLVALYRS
jgi:hypothetical protein